MPLSRSFLLIGHLGSWILLENPDKVLFAQYLHKALNCFLTSTFSIPFQLATALNFFQTLIWSNTVCLRCINSAEIYTTHVHKPVMLIHVYLMQDVKFKHLLITKSFCYVYLIGTLKEMTWICIYCQHKGLNVNIQ